MAIYPHHWQALVVGTLVKKPHTVADAGKRLPTYAASRTGPEKTGSRRCSGSGRKGYPRTRIDNQMKSGRAWRGGLERGLGFVRKAGGQLRMNSNSSSSNTGGA